MVQHLPDVVHAPERLRLALLVRRHEVRQSERALLERLIAVLPQPILHLVALDHLQDLARLLLAQRRLQRRRDDLRLADGVPLDPEGVVQGVERGGQLLRVLDLHCGQGALRVHRRLRERLGTVVRDGHVEVLGPEDALFGDPFVFVYMRARSESGVGFNRIGQRRTFDVQRRLVAAGIEDAAE